MNPDERPDETVDGYARASAAQAGRPAAATRAAILAEARVAAAARLVPAANDAWFKRRVTASIAASVVVVGVAVLLWRQVGQDPQAQVELAAVSDAATPLAEAVDEPAAAPAAAPPPPAPPAQSVAREAARRADAPAAAPALERQQGATALSSRTETFAKAREPADADLLRREFPEIVRAAEPPRGLWLLQDAQGRTVRSGTLAAGQSFGNVTSKLQQEMPDRRIEPFAVREVATDRGALVQLGYARLD